MERCEAKSRGTFECYITLFSRRVLHGQSKVSGCCRIVAKSFRKLWYMFSGQLPIFSNVAHCVDFLAANGVLHRAQKGEYFQVTRRSQGQGRCYR